MAKYTDTGQKDAIYKYLKTKAEIKLWMSPEDKTKIQAAATAAGAKSVNAFILDAVNAKIISVNPELQIIGQASKAKTAPKNPDTMDA